MTTAHRDLSSPEYWERSLARSRYRRALAPQARRDQKRRKGMSAIVAAATMAGPGTPMAFAAASNIQADVAAETPSKRAIEVREGGLPLMLGSQGPLVVEVQKALAVPADGIFGPQTEAAVRRYQARAGIQVDGIVGPVTWAALIERAGAVGSVNVPPQVKQRLERELRAAGERLEGRAATPPDDLFGSDRDVERDSGAATAGSGGEGANGGQAGAGEAPAGEQTENPSAGRGQEPTTPVPTSCGSSTLTSPVDGTVTSEFGPRWGRNHDGVDIAAPTGTAIRAAACGSVTIAGTQSGYGNIVCITHTSQFATCYAHMSRFAVSQGAQVRQGQVIGYVGCTGSCTGPHLHFETRVDGEAQDPRRYLNGGGVPGGRAAVAGAAGGRSGATTTARGGATAEGTRDRAATGRHARWNRAGDGSGQSEVLAASGAELVDAAMGPTTPTAPPSESLAPAEAAPAPPVEPAPVDAAPAEPAPVPAEPVAVPVAPEPLSVAAPAEPAPVPAEPVAAPVAPEPVPVEPAPVPAEPVAASVDPAAMAVAPTPPEPVVAPVEPAPVSAVSVAAPVEAAPAPAEPVAEPSEPAVATAAATTPPAAAAQPAESVAAPTPAPASGGVPAQ